MTPPPICAIVVAYNGRRWLPGCLDSLRTSAVPVHTIVVDNASTDGSAEYVAQQYPTVELIRAGDNLGFGKANNLGLRRALDRDCPAALLLNQDARLLPGALPIPATLIEHHPAYGILSPLHDNGDGSALDAQFTSYIQPDLCPQLLADLQRGHCTREIYSLPFVNAAAWFVSRDCLECVGGFDPLFAHYSEDNDYCRRVLASGLKIGIVPRARIRHDRQRLPRSKADVHPGRVYGRRLLYLKTPDRSYARLWFDSLTTDLRRCAGFALQGNLRALRVHLFALFRLLRISRQIRRSRQQLHIKLNSFFGE